LVDARLGWYITHVTFTIELEREQDGRWIAEIPALPGVLCYGHDRDEAVRACRPLLSALLPNASRKVKLLPSSSTSRSRRREQLAS
jgi:predicted RNase H-like HicB family nuclease